MVRDFAYRERMRKEGGDLVATLLFVVSALVAVAIVGATWWFLAPRDTTIARVPASARVYVHAQGTAAIAELASTMPLRIPATTADELAFFSSSGKDGSKWHAILSWRSPRRPSDRDLDALKTASATELGTRAFVIGDRASFLSDAEAVAVDPSIAHALADAGARSRIQGYVAPQKFDGAHMPLMTFGIVSTSQGHVVRFHDDGPATDSSRLAGLDLVTLLLGRKNDAPDQALTDPSDDLRRLLHATPFALEVRLKDARPVGYAMMLPEIDRRLTLASLRAYATTANPSRRPFVLPDADRVVELHSPDGASDEVALAGDALGKVRVLPNGTGTLLLAGESIDPTFPGLLTLEGTGLQSLLEGIGLPAFPAKTLVLDRMPQIIALRIVE